MYAVDDSMTTWWQPAKDDASPSLTVTLSKQPMEIRSARIIWRDVGLDIKKGHLAGPFGYTVEAKTSDGEWICVLDKRDNTVDMTIEYLPIFPTRAVAVRINVTSTPEHITPGLVNFTVFGF